VCMPCHEGENTYPYAFDPPLQSATPAAASTRPSPWLPSSSSISPAPPRPATGKRRPAPVDGVGSIDPVRTGTGTTLPRASAAHVNSGLDTVNDWIFSDAPEAAPAPAAARVLISDTSSSCVV
jgi:hypothetical protein